MLTQKGVDVVINSASELPFCDDYADATVSTSCFEHAELFWLTFNEMVRITKPGGFIYISTPLLTAIIIGILLIAGVFIQIVD